MWALAAPGSTLEGQQLLLGFLLQYRAVCLYSTQLFFLQQLILGFLLLGSLFPQYKAFLPTVAAIRVPTTVQGSLSLQYIAFLPTVSAIRAPTIGQFVSTLHCFSSYSSCYQGSYNRAVCLYSTMLFFLQSPLLGFLLHYRPGSRLSLQYTTCLSTVLQLFLGLLQQTRGQSVSSIHHWSPYSSCYQGSYCRPGKSSVSAVHPYSLSTKSLHTVAIIWDPTQTRGQLDSSKCHFAHLYSRCL